MVAGSLAAATAVATIVALTGALARSLDPGHYCDTGFSTLINCTLHWSTTTTGQGTPIFAAPSSSTSTPPSGSHDSFRPISTDVTLWAVAHCPRNTIARHLLCAVPRAATLAPAERDDLAAGLPLPKPWLLRTAKNSPFIESVHVETPLGLADTLGFYRAALSKRGWTENGGAVVESDRAVIAFATSGGPALLRLIHQDDRTIADLSLRKPTAENLVTNAGLPPRPGQVKLKLGNATDEDAVITINEQTVKLAARAGRDLEHARQVGGESSDSPEIDLPPGKVKVTLKVASGAAESREFEVAADETWGLLAGPAGVPLAMRLY
ncbi:hypothetical protein [Bradyrhizobium sp. CCBAU 53421]|uniref:hypothetical protein n=1 Tax=Bradyrhizobium sp. CCBAU 53421 TaxID=1325120 RepID=UPI00188A82DD|nr:hypothetical protein [Bradyrhizobium sp. CCBAU 53421]QOZ32679.1 hypothetical protein XH92_14000 [Bradyrhizobium sp. CCBAU 53421]